MLAIILFLVFGTVAIMGYALIPAVQTTAAQMGEKRQRQYAQQMEQVLSRQEARKMSRFFVIAPIIFGGGCFFLAPEGMQLFGVLGGAAFGLIFPSMYIQSQIRRSKEKFSNQLIDALMIMSSSFRGGLSLVQAMESVVEEMPDPINKEFATVLGENKMGVSLEEALTHLYNRMPSSALQQMTTAILLARETGGNLPIIFGRIVTNIRERKKIQSNLDTLTIQGKLQGFLMALLPIGFAGIVYTTNKRIFVNMFNSDVGRTMLIYAFVSEVLGAIMIMKISSFKDF